jgi:hypothetical protein
MSPKTPSWRAGDLLFGRNMALFLKKTCFLTKNAFESAVLSCIIYARNINKIACERAQHKEQAQKNETDNQAEQNGNEQD